MVIAKIIKNRLLKHFTLMKIYKYTYIHQVFDTGQWLSVKWFYPLRYIWQCFKTVLIVTAGWWFCCPLGSSREARDAVKYLSIHRTILLLPPHPHPTPKKEFSSPNVCSARVRKPWSRTKAFSWCMNLQTHSASDFHA